MSAQQLNGLARRSGEASAAVLANDQCAAPAPSVPSLERARHRATEERLAYAGNVSPAEAFELTRAGIARILDVRTPEERKFVGYIPDSLAVPWATGTAFTRNPRFLRELEGKAAKDQVLLFICRSGSRSVQAAEAAARAGFVHAFNVQEGFEGELDERSHRGTAGGWRAHGLPWVQD